MTMRGDPFSWRPSLAGWACGFAFLMCARFGAAAPVDVRFEGAVGCADDRAFRSELEGRVGSTTATARSGVPRVFDVRIQNEGESFVGRFSGEDSEGHPIGQEVRGAACSDVFDALVLIAALAIDPD